MNNYRLTQEDIEGVILREEYITLGEKTVVCVLTLKNGFEVVGSASCIDPENFDFEIGQELAYEDAVNQIWKLEGYLLQQDKYEDELLEEEDEMFVDDCTGCPIIIMEYCLHKF